MAHELRFTRLAAALSCAVLQALATPGVAAPPALTLQQGMQAKTVQLANKKFGPEYTMQIKELNNRQVKLYGFMLPLDQSRKQKRFLLTAFSPHCAFCMPGGPESIVEVLADNPVEFSYEPVLVAGRLEVLDNDIVYYRLSGAAAARD